MRKLKQKLTGMLSKHLSLSKILKSAKVATIAGIATLSAYSANADYHEADLNNDWQISSSEVNTFITNYANNSTVSPNRITMQEYSNYNIKRNALLSSMYILWVICQSGRYFFKYRNSYIT